MRKNTKYFLFLLISVLSGGLLCVVFLFALGISGPVLPFSQTEISKRTPESQSTNSIAWMLADPVRRNSASQKLSGANTKEVITALKEENSTLLNLNDQLKVQLADIFKWMLDNYKGKYPLAENQITNLDFSAVTTDFKVSPDVIKFMHLTDEDVAGINDLFAYGGSILDELIDANISVSEYESGRVVLHIPTFPEEGAELQEDIYSALSATLGPDRFNRMLDVSEDKLIADFHYFGNASRTVIFEPVYSEDGNDLLWTIKDGWIIQEADQSKTIMATETTVMDIPEAYYRYAVYLPDYLQTAKQP